MFIPYGSDSSTGNTPYMTVFLITLCAALFLLFPLDGSVDRKVDEFCKSRQASQISDTLTTDTDFSPNPSIGDACLNTVDAILSGRAEQSVKSAHISRAEKVRMRKSIEQARGRLDFWGWRAFQPRRFSVIGLLTSALFHDGWMHLLGNMLFLAIFGSAFEAATGPFELLVVFFGASMVANLVYYFLSLAGMAAALPTLGASAGIYGVMAGVWRKTPELRIKSIFWMLFMVQALEIPVKIFVGLYVLLDMFGLIFGGGTGTNLIAHVAGFYFIFLLLSQVQTRRRNPIENRYAFSNLRDPSPLSRTRESTFLPR